MPVIDIHGESFERTIGGSGITLVEWWAPWCGPCKAFAPIFERAAERHPDIHFGKVNTEEEPSLAGSFGIRAIPTLMAFRDGFLVFEQAGVLEQRGIEGLIEAVRALDMDELRAELAKRYAVRRT